MNNDFEAERHAHRDADDKDEYFEESSDEERDDKGAQGHIAVHQGAQGHIRVGEARPTHLLKRCRLPPKLSIHQGEPD